MTSVKGMTWGSPEFVAVAKAAEREGASDEKFTELAEELLELVNECPMSMECYGRIRQDVKEAFLLFDEDEMECDCDCY